MAACQLQSLLSTRLLSSPLAALACNPVRHAPSRLTDLPAASISSSSSYAATGVVTDTGSLLDRQLPSAHCFLHGHRRPEGNDPTCSEDASQHATPGALPSLGRLKVRCGGGPRTFPGGVTKWQWQRMLDRKRRMREKAALRREREEYESQRREFLRLLRGPERPWEDWSSDRVHISTAFNSAMQPAMLQTGSRRTSAAGYTAGAPALGLPSWPAESHGPEGAAEAARRRRCPWETPAVQGSAEVASSDAAPLLGHTMGADIPSWGPYEGSDRQGGGRRNRQQRGRVEEAFDYNGRVAEDVLPAIPWLTGEASRDELYGAYDADFSHEGDTELNKTASASREPCLEDDTEEFLYESGSSFEYEGIGRTATESDNGERGGEKGWNQALEALLAQARQQSEDNVASGEGASQVIVGDLSPEHTGRVDVEQVVQKRDAHGGVRSSVQKEQGRRRRRRQPQVLPPVPEHLLRRLEKSKRSLDLWNEND